MVQADLDRNQSVALQVNALVTVAEGAPEVARQAEAAVLAGEELAPLYGVPFTVGDSIDTVIAPKLYLIPPSRAFSGQTPGTHFH